ncbi:MAG: IS1380 family transposase, partial [Deltaproteobacteria bacterium]
MKRFIIKQSDEEFYTSHSGLALIGLALNRFTSLTTALKVMDAPGDLISGLDIIRSYRTLLAQGKSDFVAIEQYRNDDFFREALGCKTVPSEGTLLQ